MPTQIAILNLSDIAVATQLAKQHDDARFIVFDPSLVDRVVVAGLTPYELITWDGAPDYPHFADAALHEARRLGAAIDAVVEPELPGLRLGTWQQLSLYYQHLTLGWYDALFEAQAHRLQGHKLVVPVADSAQRYYFHGFPPGLLLLKHAQALGIELQGFTYGTQPPAPQPVPDLRGVCEQRGDFLLTHLPTCLYDGAHFNDEMVAAGKSVINLRARNWNVDLACATAVEPMDADDAAVSLPEADLACIDRVVTALAAPLDAHFARWLNSPNFRGQQVQLQQAAFRAQLITHALLQTHFAAARPSRLVLSGHDTDYHGPLLAWARAQRVPVLVLPHSKTSTDLDFPAAGSTVLHHASQGYTVCDADDRRPAQFVMDFPATLQFSTHVPARVQTVGLLLNAVSVQGVPEAHLAPYLQGVRRMVAWAQRLGLNLVLRARPGSTILHLLARTGLSSEQITTSTQGTMAEFADRCDLCLMYDAPTSGAIELLNRGVATLNPKVSALHRRHTPIATELVPSASVEDTLVRATQLVSDPSELLRFRKRQFLGYAERCSQAVALRSLL